MLYFKRAPRIAARATILLAGLAGFAPVAAQDPGRAEVTFGRAAGPIRLDGVLDEPDWQEAGLITDLTQQSPVPGGPTPYATEVRLLTDGATIYIGVHCADPDPRRIATHTMLRDADLSSDDAVGFVFDTFGDHRTGYDFLVNAAGARYDGLIVTAEEVSADWDGIWDAKVTRDDSGWTLEMAIPIATLRFNPDLDAWGFNVVRTVPRDRTEMRWTGTTPISPRPRWTRGRSTSPAFRSSIPRSATSSSRARTSSRSDRISGPISWRSSAAASDWWAVTSSPSMSAPR